MDIKEKARESMNWFERVLHKIPGFKGYYEKEFRRDADRLQREFIVRELQGIKESLNRVIQAVSRQKNLELLTEYDLFARGLQKTTNEIRYADQGYSGFFDLIKIKEDALDTVYEQDALIVETANSFREEFKELADSPLEPSRLNPLQERLEQIDKLFEQRTALLKGYAKGESK